MVGTEVDMHCVCVCVGGGKGECAGISGERMHYMLCVCVREKKIIHNSDKLTAISIN